MMNVGFGQACITPPLGLPMEGLGQIGGIERIHDDLFARVLWFEQDDRQLVILSLDLLFFERTVTDRLRGAVARLFDLKLNEVLLNFTHTHAGPRCSEWHYSGKVDPVYLDKVEQGILVAVGAAAQSREPVECWAGATTTDLPVSRRCVNAAGHAEWLPNPAAEVCRHLPVAIFKTPAGAVKAVVFSAACHPSMIYTLDVSAEWPGVAVRRLNEHFQTSGSVFLQGAAGDTKPRQVADSDKWRPGTWEEMEAAGREIADAVIRAPLQQIEPDLRIVTEETFWPLGALPTRTELQTVADKPDRRAWAVDMLRRLELFGRLPDAVPMTFHGVQLGKGLRLIALECEMVGELGNLIRRESPAGVTFPLGYTNGCAIYLPSDRQLPEHGYEVDSFWEYHWPAPLAPGINDRLRGLVRGLMEKGIT
ncbi:MAG: hypothetical protein PCFJNLEI_01644 [Verrucomicrobiae bacterium]|nr:hypothetical protein [Verrucomicrobiae bacterium]